MKNAKNGTWKIVSLVIVLMSAAVAYGMLKKDVQENSKMRPEIHELKTRLAVFETRQQAILECVRRIEAKLDERSP